MARVFTPGEVYGGLVPTPGDVLATKHLLSRYLERLVIGSQIYGARFFGSTAFGTPTSRSDIDVYIQTTDHSCDDFVRAIVQGLEISTRVPIENGLIVAQQHARCGWHSLDRGLYQHISRAPKAGNIIGEDPLSSTLLVDDKNDHDFMAYVSHKRKNLNDSGRPKELRLQRALEAPVNVGRRLVEHLIRVGGLSPGIILNDRKQTVLRCLQDSGILPRNSLESFNILLELDILYDETLRRALRGGCVDYAQVFYELCDEAPSLAVEFVNGIAQGFCENIEGRVWSLPQTKR